MPAEAFFDFKKADNRHLNIGQIPPAAGFPTLDVVLARRRLSVMFLIQMRHGLVRPCR
jgi:hypothetical protein